MLKYFKRHKSQRSTENDNDVAAKGDKRHSLLSTSSFCDEILGVLEESDTQSLRSCGGLSVDACNIVDEDIFTYHSRLSMTLSSILKDADCMSCFVQYLEVKNALPLIKFYLDTNNFRIAAVGQLSKEIHNTAVSSNGALETENETPQMLNGDNLNEDEEAANNVPELKTLCDLSMHKSLTDDEKSQIYAETNKQITTAAVTATASKLKSYSQLSLCSEFSTEEDVAMRQGIEKLPAASIKDALTIYQKYLCPNAHLFVELPVTILSNLSLLLCKRQDDDEETTTAENENALPISSDCFEEAQMFVVQELERLYLTDFLQSSFYCKYCLDLISDEQKRPEQITIYDILYSEVTLFFFMEYLEQQGERECLDFWTTAINFRKSYLSTSISSSASCASNSNEIQNDAMIIYKKFFSLQSDGRLWLSDKLRCRVEACICAPPEQVANCFDLALVVTAKYLEKKYFSAFLKSELFSQYVNELKSKIHESQNHDISEDICDGSSIYVSPLQHKLSFKSSKFKSTTTTTATGTTPGMKRRHRKTLSDCTNEATRNGELFKHISQHNTLLAMDTSATHLKNLQTTGTSMSIDARQLTNPNLLWHRRYSATNTSGGDDKGGLKFGRVNSLGRYERDFETVETFNSHHASGGGKHWSLGVSGSKIKNAMRKLVNLPEHKAQEEIAWQIAEMIVKDVTNVTLKDTTTTATTTTTIDSNVET